MKFEYVYPVISTSIWGISIAGAKIVGDDGFTPIEITFFRFFLASLVFVPVLFYLVVKRDDSIPKDRFTWLMILGLSLTGVAVNNSIFYLGLAKTDAGIASLIVSLNPLMTMIFAVFMLKEAFTKRKLVAVVIGIIGVSFIIDFNGNSGKILGNLLILLAITIWGSSFSFSRKASEQGLNSVAITAWSEILGTIFLLPIIMYNHSFTRLTTISGESLFWFIFMGILSSVLAYIIHYQAIAKLGASKVAPSTNIIPLSGAISSYVLLGDQLTGYPIIGAILIISGVILVQSESSHID